MSGNSRTVNEQSVRLVWKIYENIIYVIRKQETVYMYNNYSSHQKYTVAGQ